MTGQSWAASISDLSVVEEEQRRAAELGIHHPQVVAAEEDDCIAELESVADTAGVEPAVDIAEKGIAAGAEIVADIAVAVYIAAVVAVKSFPAIYYAVH